jgi:hypothetical protein
MDQWDKIKVMSGAVASLAIPLAVVWVSTQQANAATERQMQGRFVEVAVTILQSSPTQDNEGIRSWALEIIDRYSGIPLTPAQKEDLRERVQIAGPGVFVVPNLLRLTFARARVILAERGLVLEGVDTLGTPGDIVVGQSPAAGTIVQRGAPVSVVVSGGAR